MGTIVSALDEPKEKTMLDFFGVDQLKLIKATVLIPSEPKYLQLIVPRMSWQNLRPQHGRLIIFGVSHEGIKLLKDVATIAFI